MVYPAGPRVLELVRSAQGGMKQHYINIVTGLKDMGFDVVACCNFQGDEMDKLHQKGIKVYPFVLPGGIEPIKDWTRILTLVDYIKKEKPNAVHCHGFKAGLIGRIAALIAGCPSVYSAHNFILKDEYDLFRRGCIKHVERVLAKHTGAIITVSKALRDQFVESFGVSPAQVNVIYNGVEPPLFEDDGVDIRKEWGIGEETVLIGTVARLIPSKGIEFLLEAIPSVLRYSSRVKLMIVGGGPDQERLKIKADMLKCSETIIFVGHVEYIWYYYEAFDIFILPTLSEGLGISVLEAMAAGKAVIATRTGGIPEIVRHGWNGYLVEPGNSKEIAKAILYLINNPDIMRKYGERGALEVVHNFTIKRMVEQTASIILQVVNKRLKERNSSSIIS